MRVALSIVFTSDGTPTVSYCGQSVDEARAALDAALATGQYKNGGILKNPEFLKKREYTPPAAEAQTTPVEAPPSDDKPKGKSKG